MNARMGASAHFPATDLAEQDAIAVAPHAAAVAVHHVAVENDFDFMSEAFANLFVRSNATAFQSPLWLNCLYDGLAPRLGAKPHVITVRRAGDGRLAMLIPLVIQRTSNVRILQPVDFGVADYNAVVADCAMLPAMMADAHCLTEIRAQLGVGDVLLFRKIRRSADIIAAILGGGSQAPNENGGFEITLDGATFEDWQKSRLKKKFRKGTAARVRSLEAAYGSVAFTALTDPVKIEEAIRFIGAHRPERFKHDVLGNQAYRDFYVRYAVAGAASGEAVTSVLTADGEIIAAHFGVVSKNVYHAILSAARLGDFGQYAPGLQATLGLLRARHAAGETRLDFGIGSSRYKTDFSAELIPLVNYTRARTVSGHVVSFVYNNVKPLKTALRNWIGTIR